MNIVVSSNENYIKPLKIMLLSLFRYNKNCNIFLLYSDISYESLNKLENFITYNEGKLYPILIDKTIFEGLPNMGRISKEAYYRLLVSKVLPKDMERVLYLDIDIMIRGDLSDLYNINFEGKLLGAVIDVSCDNNQEIHLERIGLNRPYHYVNSGILICNLNEMRKTVNIDDIFNTIKNTKNLYFADQDILNIYFKDKIKYIDKIYNYIPFYGLGRSRENPKIVHFIGSSKPWNANYCFRFCFEYNHYIKKISDKEDKLLCNFRFFYFIKSFIQYICNKL